MRQRISSSFGLATSTASDCAREIATFRQVDAVVGEQAMRIDRPCLTPSCVAEGAARVVAASLLATLRGGEQPGAYWGLGSCYIEFGGGRVGRVDVDFLSGPQPTGTFREPSSALVTEKQEFGSSRRARWFGR